jgi:hypothetical protein
MLALAFHHPGGAELDDGLGAAGSLANLGGLHLLDGRPDEAIRYLGGPRRCRNRRARLSVQSGHRSCLRHGHQQQGCFRLLSTSCDQAPVTSYFASDPAKELGDDLIAISESDSMSRS